VAITGHLADKPTPVQVSYTQGEVTSQ